jgi:hypothetical protein
MLFSSPQYPLFLAAVFLLYGLARAGRWPAAIARLALMTLLGDVIYLLLCRDTTPLWDPIGGLFYPLVTGNRGGGLDLRSLADYLNTVVDVRGRFLNMGVAPYNFVSALNCILAQRLVRMICTSCQRSVTYPREVLVESGLDPVKFAGFEFKEGTGCLECNGTGYHGRTAIHELLDLSDKIRDLIVDKKPT